MRYMEYEVYEVGFLVLVTDIQSAIYFKEKILSKHRIGIQ